MSVGFLDLLAIVLIAASAFRGFRRGFLREGMALGGLAAGLILATRWHQQAALILQPFVGGGRLLGSLSFLMVILLVLLAASLLTALLQRLVKSPFGAQLDRLGGLLFGAALGTLLVALMMFVLVKYRVLGLDSPVLESELPGRMVRLIPLAAAYLPPDFPVVSGFFELGR